MDSPALWAAIAAGNAAKPASFLCHIINYQVLKLLLRLREFHVNVPGSLLLTKPFNRLGLAGA